MPDISTVWTVVGIATPVIIGLGCWALTLTPPDFKVARGSFWISGLLMLFASFNAIWQSRWSAGQKSTATVVVAVVVVVALVACLLWVRRREALAVEQSRPRLDPQALRWVTDKIIASHTSTHGNLRMRAIQLSNEILAEICARGWPTGHCSEIRQRIDPAFLMKMPPEDDRGARLAWTRGRSRFFMWKFYDDVRLIRDELAQVHLRDTSLDAFIARCEALKASGQIPKEHGLQESPQHTFVSPWDYISVSESLARLAAHTVSHEREHGTLARYDR